MVVSEDCECHDEKVHVERFSARTNVELRNASMPVEQVCPGGWAPCAGAYLEQCGAVDNARFRRA